MQILPLLHRSFGDWLGPEHPELGRLRGIVRRSWTEAEFRLGLAREAAAAMRGSGCTVVGLLGAPALYSKLRGSGKWIRPVENLRFLVRREDWRAAKAGLESAGWRAWATASELERVHEDYTDHVAFDLDGKLTAYVQWRILPGSAVAGSERVFLDGLEASEDPALCGTLNAECAMLDALVGRVTGDPDVVPWDVDVALVQALSRSGGAARLDWENVARIANEFECEEAFTRIAELRESLGGIIPADLRYVPKPKPHPAKVWYWRMHQKLRAAGRRPVPR